MHEILDRLRGEQRAVRVERLDAEILRAADDAAGAQFLDLRAVAAATDPSVARNAPDRLLALVGVPAEQQVGDALLGDDAIFERRTTMTAVTAKQTSSVGFCAEQDEIFAQNAYGNG